MMGKAMFIVKNVKNLVLLLSALVMTAGCSMTTAQAPAQVEEAIAEGQRLSSKCVTQVFEREHAVRTSISAAQFMALANQASACLGDITFYPAHPDNETAMRLNALAVVNYLKSGDIAQAKSSFTHFTRRFAQQDLVFADYTSFLDTATALLEPNLSSRQLAMLNINPTLRSELNRTREWSLN
ncbi:hypothetical protein [Glaciecola sp. SC05]|uniref:hypothetical protein n=1 Tax=Glaciecola sp. SC05 TaxID=1987355 RepID=UPI003528A9F5